MVIKNVGTMVADSKSSKHIQVIEIILKMRIMPMKIKNIKLR
jgi:hypothetical protein